MTSNLRGESSGPSFDGRGRGGTRLHGLQKEVERRVCDMSERFMGIFLSGLGLSLLALSMFLVSGLSSGADTSIPAGLSLMGFLLISLGD